MEMYAAYIKEREGRDLIVNENGFVSYYVDPGKQAGVIIDLYVKPEARRTKQGAKLLEQAMNQIHAQGIGLITAVVDTQDLNISRSRAFLESVGLKETKAKLLCEMSVHCKELI